MQEAAGEQHPHQAAQRRHRRRDRQHGRPAARAHAAEQVQGIGPAPDLGAVGPGVGQQVLKDALGLEIDEVIQADEHQRGQHNDEALVPELLADFCRHPAQGAGEHQHRQGDQQGQHQSAQNGGRRDPHGDPIDDHRRKDHHGGVHQAHQIHPGQPGRHQAGHRNRHGQQQVVILGQVQPRVGVEYAAEGSQQHGDQAHQRKIEPAQARRRQRPAELHRQQGENAAQDARHQQDEQPDIQGRGQPGASLVLLGVVKIGPKNLKQLLFQQELQHDSPSSSRNTSSRESSPLASSMVPERISLPPWMMATLSQSFSATSSTWVEKKMAPPSSQTWRIIPLSRWDALGSRPTKGSSMRISLGRCSQAEIMASFCFMPWE